MPKLFMFLNESDSESIRRSHRRRAKEIAVSMSKMASVNKNIATETMVSRPAAQRTMVSKITGRDAGRPLIPLAGGQPGSSASHTDSRTREEDTIQALMDLSLPRFARLEDGALPKSKLWPITEQPPSSPVSARNGNRTRTPSPCYQLDDISSGSSIGETSMNDYKLTLPTESTHSITPVGSIVFSSDDEVPLSSGQEDRRKVRRREVGENDRPGPIEVPEYVPKPREEPVDIPIYNPTPRDRPVYGPIIGVWPAVDQMYDPMLGEWPVDDRIFEPKTQLRPVGGQTMRESPVDTLVYKPTLRERPGGEKPYGPRPKERPVEVPKLKGRPVDGWEYEPILREWPVGAKAKELTPEVQPVDNPTLVGRPVDGWAKKPTSGATPVDDEACELMPQNQPIADSRLTIRPVNLMTYELTPRDGKLVNQTIMR